MKLTPLDIHHKEFRHSLRGYAEEEVDQFLDQVADELERLFKENIDLSEKLDAAHTKVNEFEMQRMTINNTLMAAQRSADDIVAKAGTDAEATLRDAEVKAKEIIHAALAKKQQVAAELARIKQAEEDFRARYRAMLEQNLRSVSEIGLPDDVNLLMDGTDDALVADVEVRPAPAPAPMPAPAVPAPAPAPVVDADSTRVMSAVPAPMDTPQASGFVQGVTLGEVASPEIPADVELVEPSEFSLPRFDSFGEREDDVDIEEID